MYQSSVFFAYADQARRDEKKSKEKAARLAAYPSQPSSSQVASTPTFQGSNIATPSLTKKNQ